MSPEQLDVIRDRARIDVIAPHLGLPLQRAGAEWKCCCPFHAEKTPSFTIFADGQRYQCFGCEAKGDVFALIQALQQISFPEAVRRAAEWSGAPRPDARAPAGAALYPPAKSRRQFGRWCPERYTPLRPGSAAWGYLTKVRRIAPASVAAYGILELSADAVAAYVQEGVQSKRLAAGTAAGYVGPALVFPYRQRRRMVTGDWEAVTRYGKLLAVERVGGKKLEWREPVGRDSILFGMDVIDALEKKADPLVICEGEIDALSWHTYGYPAVSVPNGAGSLGWVDACWEWLEGQSRILLSFDHDAAGEKPLAALLARLGRERCVLMQLPESPET